MSSDNRASLLTSGQAREIFMDHRSTIEIAIDYGVPHGTVCGIKGRDIYRSSTDCFIQQEEESAGQVREYGVVVSQRRGRLSYWLILKSICRDAIEGMAVEAVKSKGVDDIDDVRITSLQSTPPSDFVRSCWTQGSIDLRRLVSRVAL